VCEHGVKVEDDKLVAVQGRNRSKCPLRELASKITAAGKGLSDEEKAKLAAALRAMLANGVQS